MLTGAIWPYKPIAAPLIRERFLIRDKKKPPVESTGITMVAPVSMQI
jgi:hypothetical protein